MTNIVVLDEVCSSQLVSMAAAKGAMSLIERGFSRYGHSWDLPAIAAIKDGECLAVILLKHDKSEKTVTVALAWCEKKNPDALVRILMRLRQWCRDKEVTEVYFTCHDENSDMARAAKALQAEPWSHTYKCCIK